MQASSFKPARRHARGGWWWVGVVALWSWNPTSPLPARAGPQEDYQLHCQGCHAPDGGGAPGGAPSFDAHLPELAASAAGREYLLRVPGVTQSELDDTRTAAVMNWLLRNTSSEPFTAAEVARWRRSPLLDVGATRRALRGTESAHRPMDGSGGEHGGEPGR